MTWQDEIKRYREENQLTQAGLSRLLDVASMTVVRWESGHVKPKLSDQTKYRARMAQYRQQAPSRTLGVPTYEIGLLHRRLLALVAATGGVGPAMDVLVDALHAAESLAGLGGLPGGRPDQSNIGHAGNH